MLGSTCLDGYRIRKQSTSKVQQNWMNSLYIHGSQTKDRYFNTWSNNTALQTSSIRIQLYHTKDWNVKKAPTSFYNKFIPMSRKWNPCVCTCIKYIVYACAHLYDTHMNKNQWAPYVYNCENIASKVQSNITSTRIHLCHTHIRDHIHTGYS